MKRYSAPSPLYPPGVVAKKLNKSVRTINNWVKKDNTFPSPIRTTNGKILGWVPATLEEWQRQQN